MEWSNIIVLSSSFFVLLFIGVPISFSIGIASLLTIMLSIPFDAAIAVISQKMASGLDSFSLLAIPFFILAGNIMNRGGIAMRLIEFAKVIGGRLPGSCECISQYDVWFNFWLCCSIRSCNGRDYVAFTKERRV